MTNQRSLGITKKESDAIHRVISELKYLEKKPKQHLEKIKELADIVAHHNSYHTTSLSLFECPPLTREEEQLLKQAEEKQNKLRALAKISLPFRFLIPMQKATWETLEKIEKVSGLKQTRVDLEALEDEDKAYFYERGVTSLPVPAKGKLAQKQFATYQSEVNQVDGNIQARAAQVANEQPRDHKKELLRLHEENRRMVITTARAAKSKPKVYTPATLRHTVFSLQSREQLLKSKIKSNSIPVPRRYPF